MRPAAVLFGVGYGANQFSPLMVAYREQGHYSSTAVAAFFGIYVLGLVPGLLLSGPASQRWGRRRVLLPAAVLAVPASVVLAFGGAAEPLLYAGRLLFGVSMGVAMAVATTWVKELSAEGGARRAALAITLGFGAGPLVGGLLAQYAPWPMELPYAVHVLIMVPVLAGLLRAPETVRPGAGGPLWRELRVPSVTDPRFVRLVLPAAPWVFGAVALSYAVQPALLAPSSGGHGLLVATGLTTVSLAVGFAAQSFARTVERKYGEQATTRAGLVLVIGGTLVTMLVAATASLPAAFAAAALLGAGYGFVLLSGLQQVQRIAAPGELAGLTAVFYSVTYLGFLLPVALSALSWVPGGYPVLLLGVALLQALCLGLVWRGAGRPARELVGV
ncbi:MULTISPECIES: MFS transporter [Pseudonocardia]|uniref:Major facilitator family transporter n=2 Tax=Pseudonocardia TaxID=1847 RepID=A0ABQ0S250_9PSEU|nr:putative 3-hydroxyphenylpropionic transporter MhpT [Pseudonocardia autotrophica]TDN76601.1 putative MFS family arabinose efflux permease [Pseudonocardia autotrophica]BBG00602.1 major facilitator family transporter [Pseudonocardia autotrophica]GEC26986.1 major facilitator family transporter [Pseudonocardia saturnea]